MHWRLHWKYKTAFCPLCPLWIVQWWGCWKVSFDFQFFQFCPQSTCSRAWLKISILFINTFFVCCRLYRCAHSTTEIAHFMSSPRWSPNGVINETAICEALTRMSQCEEETACKEMAKGIWYTTASVSIWKVNKKWNFCPYFLYTISNFIRDPQPEIWIV